MNFPNAANGVKKIFTSQVLDIVSAIIFVIMAITSIVTVLSAVNENAGATVGFGLGSIVLALGGTVVAIVAAILMLVGVIKAGKDDQNFKTALAFIVLGIVAAVIGSCFQSSNVFVYNICSTISKIADLCTTCYIIMGVISLAEQLGETAVAEKGKSLFKVILAVYVISILGMACYTVFYFNSAFAVIGGVILCISYIVSIVAYFLFISLLLKAKKMLNQ